MPAIDNIRIWESDAVYFVTNRCINAQFMMAPERGGEVQRICLACLAWAANKHQIDIFAYIFMSNHFHLLVRAPQRNLSQFMADFQRELAARLNRHHQRTGTVFDRRFDAPKVLDDAMVLEKLAYIVNNPCLSNLVRHPGHWPGVSSWSSHATGQAQIGRLIDYKELRRLRRKDPSASRKEAMRHDVLELATPPMWQDKSEDELKQAYLELIEEPAIELQRQRARRRKTVVGPTKVMQQKYWQRPDEPKCTPRVKCLSTDEEKRTTYLEARARTVDAYKCAMSKWRDKKRKTMPRFPAGTFPPGHCRCVAA